MADRISSDHPTVDTVRASLESTTTGVAVVCPEAEADLPGADTVVRLVIDGDQRFARFEPSLTGGNHRIRGVYSSPNAVRDPAGEQEYLREWVDTAEVRIGGSVLLDIIEPDFLYGLRAPGETAYYEATEPPNQSLQSIAESLEE
ncbi:MAG: hypothetical protein U5K37_10765 [Natrialbaceae archaeon]|nr:hypothetical protein [Natrialbaceae archaeon]